MRQALGAPPTDATDYVRLADVGGSSSGATPLTISGGSATPDAGGGRSHFRASSGASFAITLPAGGADTQRIVYEVTATNDLTITLAAGYELGGNVRSRSIPVRSGATAYIYPINRQGTWRLLAVDDGG